MDSETFHKIKKFKIQIDLKVKSGKYSHYVLEQFDTWRIIRIKRKLIDR